MTADEFATLVRSGHGKLRVTKVLLNAEGRKVKGNGLLEIMPTQLELRLEVNPQTTMPKSQKNIWVWSLSGTIENDLRFTCDRVSPSGRTDRLETGKAPRTTQVLHLSRTRHSLRGSRLRRAAQSAAPVARVDIAATGRAVLSCSKDHLRSE
jgi:hypothetical protein